ncbi:MAG: hypothetical protein ACR2KQ_05160 [Actinomycetota bacterium]
MITEERGAALVEVLTLGLVLLIPLMWTLTVAADLHRGALASSAAVREAGLEASRLTDHRQADAVVRDAVARAFLDHGLRPQDAIVSWRASSLERGSHVEVRVGYAVTVLQAPFIGRTAGPAVWIRARHVARVDPYGSRDG